MTTSWMEITDTAIKIGLGALIAGIFSIFLIFATNYKDKLADRRNRRLKHIEDGVGHAESYFNYLIKHAASAAWFNSSDLDAPDAEQARKDYEMSKSRWDEGADHLNTATSRLILIGLEKISDQLREASDLADRLLTDIEAGGSYEQEMKKFQTFRSELRQKRREIMRMFQEAYVA
jgi:hypothetical protein